MAKPLCSDADFERMFLELGAAALARRLQISLRNIYARRERLENKLGRQIRHESIRSTRVGASHPGRIEISAPDGIVLVGSDAHIWPGPYSTALRAFIQFCKDLKPRVVVMNGDVMDFASISRYPPIGWEKQPTVIEEIEAAQKVMAEVLFACPKGSEKIWTLGNHDSRFETRVATVAPELAKVAGIHLRDHFGTEWQPCWSAWINNVVIKHRYKGGIHATHNNTIWAGQTMVTGHLHSLKVTPFTDYKATRFGVDTGCLANTSGQQFGYLEDNPRNWRSGFAVLTFRNGRLMWPELVHVLDEDHVEFRSEIIQV